MYVIEYILKFLLVLAFYLLWAYCGWLEWVTVIIFRHKVKKLWQVFRGNGSLHQKYNKDFKKWTGNFFVIFQRLLWAPHPLCPHLHSSPPLTLTTLKVISINRNYGEMFAHDSWEKKIFFITKSSWVQELQNLYLFKSVITANFTAVLWDFIFAVRYLMTESIFNKILGN